MRAGGHFSLFIIKQNVPYQVFCYSLRLVKALKKPNTYVLPLFQSCNRCLLGCKVISSLLSIKIRVHVIDNSIRGGRVERDAGGDEKQLIKFAWPYLP